MINDLIKYLVKAKTYIPKRKQLKYINPDIYNECKNDVNLDCIKEYIHYIIRLYKYEQYINIKFKYYIIIIIRINKRSFNSNIKFKYNIKYIIRLYIR